MSKQELPKLQDVGDRLIADVAGVVDLLIADIAKPSHVADEIFCSVVPTDGTNCGLLDSQNRCLLDSQNRRIVRALTWWLGPAKRTRHRRWCADCLSDA